MYSQDSEAYMTLAAELSSPFLANHLDWNPQIDRFFRFKDRQAIWDMSAYLYHLYYQGVRCEACLYGYSGHTVTIERGKILWQGKGQALERVESPSLPNLPINPRT